MALSIVLKPRRSKKGQQKQSAKSRASAALRAPQEPEPPLPAPPGRAGATRPVARILRAEARRSAPLGRQGSKARAEAKPADALGVHRCTLPLIWPIERSERTALRSKV